MVVYAGISAGFARFLLGVNIVLPYPPRPSFLQLLSNHCPSSYIYLPFTPILPPHILFLTTACLSPFPSWYLPFTPTLPHPSPPFPFPPSKNPVSGSEERHNLPQRVAPAAEAFLCIFDLQDCLCGWLPLHYFCLQLYQLSVIKYTVATEHRTERTDRGIH